MLFLVIVEWILMIVCSSSALSNQDSCPSKSRRVLSYDHQLLSPYNMTASSADLTSPVHYLVSRSNSPVRVWCTAPDTGTSHHIYLNFTYPVVVEHVISAGFSNGYVTNFSIEYSSNWSNWFTAYHNLHIQQYFLVPHIDFVFTLDQPLVANSLQLLIHDGVLSPSDRLCWHITFLGCLLTEMIGSTTESLNVRETVLSLQPSSSPPLCSSTLQDHGVGLALGSAVAVTVLLLLMIIVTTLTYILCLRQSHCQGRKMRGDTNQSHSSIQRAPHNTPRCLRCGSADAGPYEIPLPSPGVGQDRLVNNPLYSLPYEHLQHWRKTSVVRTPNQRCLVPVATVSNGSNDCTSSH